MNLEEYMTFEAIYEKNLGDDDEMLTPSFDSPVNIKCFKYGDIRNYRYAVEGENMNDKTYLTTTEVFVGDKIDGQVVRNVCMYPEFDGTEVLYEVHVLNP